MSLSSLMSLTSRLGVPAYEVMMAGRSLLAYAWRMDVLGETLQRMKDYWLLGLMVMIALGAAALGAAALALILLVPFALIFGWEGDALETWLLISAVFWLPVAIGHAAVNLKHLLKLPRNADDSLRPGAVRR